jgi:hypothetical protein
MDGLLYSILIAREAGVSGSCYGSIQGHSSVEERFYPLDIENNLVNKMNSVRCAY